MRAIATFALMLLAGCAVAPNAAGEPAWLARKVAELQSLPPFSPPRSILGTTYAGRKAYYVTPACCDIPSELYDEEGTLLCYPGGGFAGGDGRCPDFTLQSPAVVWQDKREPARRPAPK